MKLSGFFAAMVAAPLLALSHPVAAQDYPMDPGDYVEMNMIEIMPGGAMDYANYLAGQWRKNQEFAKSKGWIKDYRVLANVDSRDGEPNLYLFTTFATVPSAAEEKRRRVEFLRWRQATDAQMIAESGDRAKFRKLRGSMLLQEQRFK